jgi:hypothetical protein
MILTKEYREQRSKIRKEIAELFCLCLEDKCSCGKCDKDYAIIDLTFLKLEDDVIKDLKEKLSFATEFWFSDNLRISIRDKENDKWAITDGVNCLSKNFGWDYESQPSSRTDEFKETHRFSFDEAWKIAWKMKGDMK